VIRKDDEKKLWVEMKFRPSWFEKLKGKKEIIFRKYLNYDEITDWDEGWS
jgi:hypothetical protein